MALRGLILLAVLLVGYACPCGLARRLDEQQSSFDENYGVTWGKDHVSFLNERRVVQLSLDAASGSGFGSKSEYKSGMFRFMIKLPGPNSGGVVTSFYLYSHSNHHDELDFEFLGNIKGKPITLQTNIFANGRGNREQKIHLWFDPTEDFHEYKILWNPYHIVFFVDGVCIRFFENKSNAGLDYPSQPMQILTSLWNGDDWATDGGKVKINWTNSPFKAHFQGFDVEGCTSSGSSYPCSSDEYWWNVGRYRKLTPEQIKQYENIKARYMTYDYCSDRKRHPVIPPECHE